MHQHSPNNLNPNPSPNNHTTTYYSNHSLVHHKRIIPPYIATVASTTTSNFFLPSPLQRPTSVSRKALIFRCNTTHDARNDAFSTQTVLRVRMKASVIANNCLVKKRNLSNKDQPVFVSLAKSDCE